MSTPEQREKVYATKRWKNVRRFVLRRDGYLCVRCQAAGIVRGARVVHHKRRLADDPELEVAFDPENLESLCDPCHARAHDGDERKNRKPAPAGKSEWDQHISVRIGEIQNA